MNELIKRLKLINDCINLEDNLLISVQLPLLKSLSNDAKTFHIIDLLEKEEYAKAQKLIQEFLASSQGLIVYENPELNAIRLELKQLELKLQSTALLRDEAQNVLQDFNQEHHLNLGSLISRILSLQEDIAALKIANQLLAYQQLCHEFKLLNQKINDDKYQLDKLHSKLNEVDFLTPVYADILSEYELVRDANLLKEANRKKIRQEILNEYEKIRQRAEYEEFQKAKDAADEFEQEYDEVKKSTVNQLDDEEKKLLKSLYRKACKLCHPDIVSDDLKEQAHDLMIEINAAYKAQSISKLQEILDRIASGGKLTSYSDSLNDLSMLKRKLEELKLKYQETLNDLEQIKSSDEYQEIIGLGDTWSEYFEDQKEQLSQVIEELEMQLADLQDSNESDRFVFTEEDSSGHWQAGYWQDKVWIRGRWVNTTFA